MGENEIMKTITTPATTTIIQYNWVNADAM